MPKNVATDRATRRQVTKFSLTHQQVMELSVRRIPASGGVGKRAKLVDRPLEQGDKAYRVLDGNQGAPVGFGFTWGRPAPPTKSSDGEHRAFVASGWAMSRTSRGLGRWGRSPRRQGRQSRFENLTRRPRRRRRANPGNQGPRARLKALVEAHDSIDMALTDALGRGSGVGKTCVLQAVVKLWPARRVAVAEGRYLAVSCRCVFTWFEPRAWGGCLGEACSPPVVEEVGSTGRHFFTRAAVLPAKSRQLRRLTRLNCECRHA